MKSSRWWPSAILLAPTSLAIRYKTPRLRRAHREQGVALTSRTSSMISPIDVCSIRYSQPRSRQVLAMTSCLKSLYPESTVTAISEKSIGARRRNSSSVCISAQLSLPPDRPTMTRSPSLNEVEVDDGPGGFLGDPRFEWAAVRHLCECNSGGACSLCLQRRQRCGVRAKCDEIDRPPHQATDSARCRAGLRMSSRQSVLRPAEAPRSMIHHHLA